MSFCKDRKDAGRRLAREVERNVSGRILVLGLPRGGVPVAYEVAKRLNAHLDTIVARKLGSLDHPEFGFGAIAMGNVRVIDEDITSRLQLDEGEIREVQAREELELVRMSRRYKSGSYAKSKRFDTIVLVDDGIATGVTAKAAVIAVKRIYTPEQLFVATPVAAMATVNALEEMTDGVICLVAPSMFTSVAQWYDDFSQTNDEEVVKILEQRRLEWVE